LNPFSGLADLVDNVNQLLGRGKYASSNAGPEPAPETLLDILTPEQRKLVLEQLARNEKRDS